MAEDQLSQAIQLAKAGRREEAHQIVTQFLRTNPKDANAWMVMAQVVRDKEQATECLQRVIRYADSEKMRQWASEKLAQLERPSSARTYPEPGLDPSQSSLPPSISDVKPETKTGRSRWLQTCAIVAGVLILGIVVCIVVTGVGLGQLVDILPTIQPQPTLVVGETYWIGVLQLPGGLLEGLTTTSINVYNKPSDPLDDPGVTVRGKFPDPHRYRTQPATRSSSNFELP